MKTYSKKTEIVSKSSKIITYKDLIIWQKAMDLVIECYRMTTKFPISEIYGVNCYEISLYSPSPSHGGRGGFN